MKLELITFPGPTGGGPCSRRGLWMIESRASQVSFSGDPPNGATPPTTAPESPTTKNLGTKVKESIFQRIAKSLNPERERVLIVDDEEPIRGLFEDFFKKRGYRVTTAASLAEAEAKLANETFDVVLQDVVLPDGDGIEFVPKIKSLHPDLPVIILTGLGYDEAVLQDAMHHQATSYLSKLLPLDQVLMEVHRVLKVGKKAGGAE
ncbi:MAG TPA: response regulator [Methylomirabilota bacterium]|nr:response regulator [Methylomirabilota bacterium]